jgi:hypothetical protein
LVEVCPWNLLDYSENFSTTYYTNAGGTISLNSGTAPNGTNTANLFTENTNTSDHRFYRLMPLISGQLYTVSIYLKMGTQRYISINAGTWGHISSICSVVFDLQNGVVSEQLNSTGAIENVGNGWYRCSLTTTSIATDSRNTPIQGNDGATYDDVYLGTGKTWYAWGYQLNIGSTAKPYFPTTDRLNVPRLTYQNGGGGCPSLLLEKQSTNYVKYSQDFKKSDWTQSGATITANAIISPDGTQNATRVQFSAGSRYVYQTIGGSGIAAGSVTISCWIKGASVQKIGFSDGNANPNEITLTTDWQRYTFTFSYSSGGIGVQFDNYFGVTPSAQTKDFYIWGAQSEQSTYPTSYIPTTSASATRVADACFKTGISSLIGQTEGVIFVDLVMKNNISSVNRVVSITESSWISGGSIRIDIQSGNIAVDIINGGATIGTISANTPFAQNTRYKIAIAYKTNDCALYMNGTQLGTNTSIGTMPTCSEFYLNELGGGFGGPWQPTEFNQAVLFKTRLTNAELASITTI